MKTRVRERARGLSLAAAPGKAEIACGSKEFKLPFPVSRGKPGREGSPHAGVHGASQPKALARADAAGSPHKRAAAPLWIPRSEAI